MRYDKTLDTKTVTEVFSKMGMTLQEIKELKKQLGLTNDQLSSLSGVPLSTVQKVLGNTTSAPRQVTLRKLETALATALNDRKTPGPVSKNSGVNSVLNPVLDPALDSVSDSKTDSKLNPEFRHQNKMALENGLLYPGYSQPDPGIFLKEPSAPYHTDSSTKGKHTIQDYYSLPEESRKELIDGVLYDMAVPDGIHQDILLILGSLFRAYILKNKEGCRVYVAPRDVQLDSCDDKTIVQPDILIVCDRDKITSRCIVGAPDFIVEILSPSTRERDLHLKASKYANSGVREYWIVDPYKKIVLVYRFTESRFPACFSFADSIPVGIWNDQLQIDFRQISEELSGLYEQ